MFAIDLKDTDFERLKTFVNALTLVLGSVGVALKVWCLYSKAITWRLFRKEACRQRIRMYVGLEEPTSIIEDIQQALDQAYGEESLL